jgi:hypothetical protein
MNRKMLCLCFVVLALAACAPQAWCSSISVASDTVITPFPATPYDITAAGNLDWVVSAVDEKAGASSIATTTTGILESQGYNAVWDGPQFSWTDGVVGSNSDGNSGMNLTNGAVLGTHVALPAGSGTVSLWWCEYAGVGPASFTASLADGPSVTVDCANSTGKLTVLNWQSDRAQTMTLSSPADSITGYWGMAVSQVPEPGTLAMLGTCLVGMIAYAWRKRK